jgi:hypothetical protein
VAQAREQRASEPIRRGVAAGALALVLLCVAASGVRARAGVTVSPDATRQAASWLIALFGVSALISAIVVSWALWPGRRRRSSDDEDELPHVVVRPKITGGESLAIGVIVLALAGAIALAFTVARQTSTSSSGTTASPAPPPSGRDERAAPSPGEDSGLSWPPFAILAGVAAAGGLVAVMVVRRRERRPLASEPVREGPPVGFGELLARLRGDPDPRRVVLAAYAGMEDVLAASGFPRDEWEAPIEYRDRVESAWPAAASSTTQLTRLFAQAKFSTHLLGPNARPDAIDALDDLTGLWEETRSAS